MSKKKMSRKKMSKTQKRGKTSTAILERFVDTIERLVAIGPPPDENFDSSLLYRIENLKKENSDVMKNVTSINQALYHPNTGIFARINEVEALKEQQIESVDLRLTSVEKYIDDDDSNEKNQEERFDKLEGMIQKSESRVDALATWKQHVTGAFKWIIMTIVGVSITIGIKLLYDSMIH